MYFLLFLFIFKKEKEKRQMSENGCDYLYNFGFVVNYANKRLNTKLNHCWFRFETDNWSDKSLWMWRNWIQFLFKEKIHHMSFQLNQISKLNVRININWQYMESVRLSLTNSVQCQQCLDSPKRVVKEKKWTSPWVEGSCIMNGNRLRFSTTLKINDYHSTDLEIYCGWPITSRGNLNLGE